VLVEDVVVGGFRPQTFGVFGAAGLAGPETTAPAAGGSIAPAPGGTPTRVAAVPKRKEIGFEFEGFSGDEGFAWVLLSQSPGSLLLPFGSGLDLGLTHDACLLTSLSNPAASATTLVAGAGRTPAVPFDLPSGTSFYAAADRPGDRRPADRRPLIPGSRPSAVAASCAQLGLDSRRGAYNPMKAP